MCPSVQTGGLGFHYAMRFPEGTRCGKIGQGIDLKANGGYVIIPPSRVFDPLHVQPYKWTVKPWECAVPEAPEWLVALVKGVPQTASPFIMKGDSFTLEAHPGSPEGARRVTLCRLVGSALGCGVPPDEVLRQAEAWASRCEPPFGEWGKHAHKLVENERVKLNNPINLSPTVNLQSPSPYKEGRKGGSEVSPLPDPSLYETSLYAGIKKGEGEADPSLYETSLYAGIKKGEGETPYPSFLPYTGIGSTGIGSGETPDPSFLPYTGLVESKTCEVSMVVKHTPFTLPPETYHGLFGEMLKAVEGETEAHPAGILLSWLTLFGNSIGNNAWVKVGARRHYGNLYTAIVGRTSDAKGDGYSVSLYPFRQADPIYSCTAIANGVGSGEGLVERVRDEFQGSNNKGEPLIIPAANDKRCLLRLSELSRAFKSGRRESSTLSEMMREAWDGEPIHVPNRGSNQLTASGYTVSVIGDITPEVLGKLLSQGTEAVDGYANRFLWCLVRSPRSLPSGGDVGVLDPFTQRLQSIILKAKGVGELKRDADAEHLWHEVYQSLKVSGDSVPHTDRARPYTLRLSMLYALADGEKVIREPHLRAALAVWEYCRQSAKTLFQTRLVCEAEPDPLWLRLLNAITLSPGVLRSELTQRHQRFGDAEAIGLALDGLKAKGLAYPVMVKGGGRTGEWWYPGEGDGGDDDGDKLNNPTHLSPTVNLHSPEPPEPVCIRKEGYGEANLHSPSPYKEVSYKEGYGEEANLHSPSPYKEVPYKEGYPEPDPLNPTLPYTTVYKEVLYKEAPLTCEVEHPSLLIHTGIGSGETCEVKSVVKLDPYEASRPDPEADPEAYDEWLLPSK